MNVFLARQPIFDREEDIFAYELLYRNEQLNTFPNIDGDLATVEVLLNSFLTIGLDELSAGKPCFINFTENLLKQDLPLHFSPSDVVIEVLETVELNDEMVGILRELKRKKFRIALDDFYVTDWNVPRELFQHVDVIKIDYLLTPKEEREAMEATIFRDFPHIKLLAEKVETREQLDEARARGYTYFQGYFFAKPQVLSTKDIPSAGFSYMDIISSLQNGTDIDSLASMIERDLSLTFKLLKLINSPTFRTFRKVDSVKQAIVLLGLDEVKKWLHVMALREMKLTNHSPVVDELVVSSLFRAKLCESVARHKGETNTAQYFLTGLFSLIDSLLGVELEAILAKMPIAEEITDALIGRTNKITPYLNLANSLQRVDWGVIHQLANELEIDVESLFQYYCEAYHWSHGVNK